MFRGSAPRGYADGSQAGPATFNWSAERRESGDKSATRTRELELGNGNHENLDAEVVFEEGPGSESVANMLRRDQYVMSSKNREAANKASAERASEQKMDTIKGVFLPCVQNIMGVILFIRLPYITGEAGVLMTMVIILLSVLTTTLTTLSMSAIATNGTVQAGGPYYIISRNLGVEIGGAIGTLFYLGTVAAASMYVLGAVETINSTLSGLGWDGWMQILALIIMGILALTVGVGVKYVNMSATLFLVVTFFSVASIVLGVILFAVGAYTGGLGDQDRAAFDNMLPRYTEDPETGRTPTFFSLLALFFPSATGIMAGCNRSASLATPGRSIPKGTLGAIGFTTSLYVLFVWLFGCIVAHETLVDDKLVAAKVAWPTQYLVSLGIIFSSCGAGMQCLVGASRLLAAIANDRTIPALAAFAPPPDKPPTRAVWLTWLLASLPCLAGNLDYIVPVITMFFLLMYGAVNLSCFVLSVLQSPGFRPEWRYYSWQTALLGVMMCISLMLIISWHMAVVSIFLAWALLFYIKYHNATRDWGDTLVGFRFQLARDMLLSLAMREMHPKNWRPQLLVFCKTDECGNPKAPGLLSLAGQMKMGRGLLMAVALLPGDLVADGPRAAEAQRVLAMHLEDEEIDGFCKVSACTDPVEAAVAVLHHAGIGTMQPNAALFGWPEDWGKNRDKGASFVQLLRGAASARRAVMVLKGAKALPSSFERCSVGETIDIWWVAHDGGLLLLVPYLLSLHPAWKRCTLRLFSVVVNPGDDAAQVERDVSEYLEQVRIRASVRAIDMSDQRLNLELYQQTMDRRAAEEHLANLGVRAVTLDMARARHDHFGDGSGGGGGGASSSGGIGGGGGGPVMVVGGGDDEEREELESADDAAGGRRRRKRRGGGMGSGDSSTSLGFAAAAIGGGGGGSPESAARDRGRRMTAVLLNRSMREHSADARLVVTNMPLVPEMSAGDVLGYCEAISEGLAPVLMIRGTGQEVITTYG